MKKNIIRVGITILSLILIFVIGFFIYGTIMTLGNSRMPVVEVPEELKILEKTIAKETRSSDHTYFDNIPKHQVEECNALLHLNILIDNDSISKSEDLLANYINSVNKRVNELLVDKKCIDSLIIEVSSYYSKEKVDNLKSKKYRYSFPIN